MYGSFRALEDISYVVREKAIVSLLGGNASGKSSSMKVIFGNIQLVSGHVKWQGERIEKWPTSRRVAAGIAAVPEGRRVFADMTVHENLEIGACNRKDHGSVRADLLDIYEQFGRLRERRSQLAGTLSGGEQQMLAIGRALMSRPKLICMDEPSMGLAPALVSQNFKLIEAIRERGTAVFVIEQNARAALKVADYVYVLRTGRIMLEGSAEDVASNPEMIAAYLGATKRRMGPGAMEENP